MTTAGLETRLLELLGMFFFYYYPLLTLTNFLQIDCVNGTGTGGLRGAATKEGQHDDRVRDAERPPLFDK